MKPFANPAVKEAFQAFPPDMRRKLLALRERVFRTAAATPGVGELEETLKWGEPAYVTRSGSGSTIRLGWKKARPGEYALYFNCRTTLVSSFRALYPRDFRFEGNRALVFMPDEELPQEALASCITMALSYRLQRKAARARG
ncbi:DUF1801 domain-containing protein [Solimonas sp. K1W22B-7]|uniref:DUF1801 domain-containing protein n=1 Tax=Solimonas sp. K1W22B-7 TaxID=2303331 RepID=UPI000E33190A|nr:DUF1801 domain-containing protein [Solimonas sp. K1W22B-7]AXQ27190.1 DUF1801 domain-containing protein [Solimonas sp. K1W22B-7]